jgi:urease accessory protein UreF
MDYMQDLTIDKDQLDEEWLKQPSIFMLYAEQAALAEDARDRAKRAAEVIAAKADQEIREKAALEGEKLTEAKVATRVATHPEVEEAERRVLETNKNAKILGAAVRAFDQRKKALEKLCDLYTQGYFSAPRSDGVEKGTRNQERKLKEKLEQ